MSNPWFKPIKYGFGAYPITWQGWIVSLFLICYCAAIFLAIPALIRLVTSSDFSILFTVIFGSYFFKITFIDKIDGGLKWRWGKK